MKIKVFCLLLTMVLPLHAEDSILVEQLHQAYDQVQYFEAEFVQNKQVKFLSKPLVSTGVIKYAPTHGMIWEVVKPIWVKTKINDEGIFKTNSFEQNVKVKDVQMQAVADILGELLGARLDRMRSQFELSASQLSDDQLHWEATLIPRSKLIKKALAQLHIEGLLDDAGQGQGISKITLVDPNENITTIVFSEVVMFNEQSPPAELLHDFQ